MKIQLVAYSTVNNRFGDIVDIKAFNKAAVFDMYDINIIDLADPNIWKFKGKLPKSVNCNNDLIAIGKLIQKNKNSKVIVLLPGNINYSYNDVNIYSSRGPSYYYHVEIKDMLSQFCEILTPIYSLKTDMVFGGSRTIIKESEAISSFFFDNISESSIATKSDVGLATTIKDGNVYISTLQLLNSKQLEDFLQEINILQKKEKAPKWFEAISKFDDDHQNQIIRESEKIIEEQTLIINSAQAKLGENDKWKSILYTQKDELVDVVKEMLDIVFGSNTLNFADEKKEDFRFVVGNTTIIGEIKGVNNNVNTYNVTQVLNHKHKYEYDHPDDHTSKKAVLIINHQRERAPQDRDKVHDTVCTLANINKVLVITTPVLLNIFEKYKKGTIDREKCIEILLNNIGILSEESLK